MAAGRDDIESVSEAFGRAQDAISTVAKSTAKMIQQSDATTLPDQMEIEFGLKFSASTKVILAGAPEGATLKVTLKYNTARIAAVSAQRP
jgi:hypothetical protein